MCGALRNLGHIINKKKVQRIIQKLGLQITSFTRKSRKYNFEFKKKIVLEYLNEGIGYITLAKKYNIK